MINENMLLSNVKNIQIILTKDCNFNCTYCFSDHGNNIMEMDTLYKLSETLKNYDTYNCNVNFFGGEPMLEYDRLIVPFVDQMKKLGYKGSYSIVTNGSLLNEERLFYMIDNKFGIMFSMDGDYDTFSKNRNENKEVFNKIINNIQYLLNVEYKNLEVRLTYTKDNILQLSSNIKFLYNLGIKKVQIYHEYDIDLNEIEKRLLKSQFKEILDFYILHKDLNIYFIDRLLHHYFNKEKYDRQVCSKCGLFNKDNFSFSINYDGNFFTCHHFNSVEDKYKDFNIGNIDKGFYLDKIENLSENKLIENNLKEYKERESKCKDCKLNTLCSANCVMQNLKLYNNIFINDVVACEINNIMFDVVEKRLSQ